MCFITSEEYLGIIKERLFIQSYLYEQEGNPASLNETSVRTEKQDSGFILTLLLNQTTEFSWFALLLVRLESS